MARRCSFASSFTRLRAWLRACLGARLRYGAGLLIGVSVPDLHLRPGNESQLAVSDYNFAWFDAAFNYGVVRDRMRHDHLAHLDSLIVFDHEDVLALLAGLDRLCRRDGRAGPRGQRHYYVDELARPEQPLFIGESGF